MQTLCASEANIQHYIALSISCLDKKTLYV